MYHLVRARSVLLDSGAKIVPLGPGTKAYWAELGDEAVGDVPAGSL